MTRDELRLFKRKVEEAEQILEYIKLLENFVNIDADEIVLEDEKGQKVRIRAKYEPFFDDLVNGTKETARQIIVNLEGELAKL